MRPLARKQGESTFQWHLRNLKAVQSELEPGHVATERIAARIEECEQAIMTQESK